MFSKTSKRPQPQPKAVEVQKKTPAATGGVPSIISADLKVLGDLHSNGDIQIDGTVEGDINSRTLTVGESAVIKGAVHAETVRVCGSVEGEVSGTNIAITSAAKIVGDVIHQSLAIEAGAFIEGHLRRLEPAKSSETDAVAGRSASKDGALGSAGRTGSQKKIEPDLDSDQYSASGHSYAASGLR